MSARSSRFLAMQLGLSVYQSEKPCLRGHLSERMTLTGTCIECRKEKEREKYASNPKKFIDRKKSFYQRNAEKIKAARREKYAENPEKELVVARVRSAEWRAANPEKVKAQKPLKMAYKKANPHKRAADVAKRRSAKMFRTPKWLDEDDIWMINQAYELASLRSKCFGFSFHVDHIIPLQGKNVSGLHVPNNLQVVPWKDNLTKANKFDEHTKRRA